MPHLRLCVGEHKGAPWWREMESERLDVEEIESDDNVLEVFESLLKRKYDAQKGPLWFVRFLTRVNKNDLGRDSNFNLKHKYVCIFGFHHNMSDGSTNMSFSNNFVSVLNRIVQKKEVDMREEGYFAYPIHNDLAYSTTSYYYLIYNLSLRVYRSLIDYSQRVRNFVSLYPMPTDQDGCTQVLPNELDRVTTERLLKRCKMEGVTLNTAFTAAANIGMLRMMLQRDASLQDTSFDSQQAVNMRRYWPKDKQKNAYGCHIFMFDLQVPTQESDIKNFWEYARNVHKIIYHELNVEKTPLKMQPLTEKQWLAIFINLIMSKFRLPSTNDSHYCVTNMGDVSNTFSGEDVEITVSKILRSVSCHFMQALCQHTLQTFKGKMYYSMDYYPQKMSASIARAYVSSLLDTLTTAIHTPN